MTIPPLNPHDDNHVPISVLMRNRVELIVLPRMTIASFKMFKEQLELFKDAILMPEAPPPALAHRGA